jgi:hypothetical protein
LLGRITVMIMPCASGVSRRPVGGDTIVHVLRP